MNLLVQVSACIDVSLSDIAEAVMREEPGDIIAELLVRLVDEAEKSLCQDPEELAAEVSAAFKKLRGVHAENAAAFIKALQL